MSSREDARRARSRPSLRTERLELATDVPNTASIAVLHRLGFEEWERTDDGVAGTARFQLCGGAWEAAD